MPLPEDLTHKLRELVGRENYLDQPADTITYGYNSFPAYTEPAAVVLFTAPEQVRKVVPLLYARGVPMVVRGSGTNVTAAALAPPGGVVLSTERMRRILELDDVSRFVRVEAGARVKEVKALAEQHGLLFPPNPGNVDAITVGGVIGCNSAGDLALGYGSTRDFIIGAELVIGDGQTIRVGSSARKDVTGYDVVRLIVGSEGTFGVVTEATLRLVPQPEAQASAMASFPDVILGAKASLAVLAARLQPVALEYMCDVTVGAVESAFQVGFPGDSKAVVLAKFYGNVDAVNTDARRCQEVLSKAGATWTRLVQAHEPGEEVWRARHLAYPALARICPTLYSEDTTVPPRHFPAAVQRFRELAKEHGIPLAIFAHAGDGNIHPCLLTDDSDPAQADKSERFVEAIIRAALELGGTITGEHGLGVAKSRFAMQQFDGPTLELMKRIKHSFDPKGLFNPMIFPLVASPPARIVRKGVYTL